MWHYAISDISNNRIITYVNVITRILRILVITFTQLSLRDVWWTCGDVRTREAESRTATHDGIKRQKQKQWIGQHWQNNTWDWILRRDEYSVDQDTCAGQKLHPLTRPKRWGIHRNRSLGVFEKWEVRKNECFGGIKNIKILTFWRKWMDNIRGGEKVKLDDCISLGWKMRNILLHNGRNGIRNMERIERRTAERPIVFATRVLSNTRHKHK